jgi:hypothetical protein
MPILRFASWPQEAQLEVFLTDVAPRLRDLVEPALDAARGAE